MRLSSKLLYVLATSMLLSSYVYGLDTIKVEDTFTIENAHNIIGVEPNNGYAVTIGADNNVRIYHKLANEWKETSQGNLAFPVDNVVKVLMEGSNIVSLLDSYGNLWHMGSKGLNNSGNTDGKFKKINTNGSVVIDITMTNSSNNAIVNILDSEGKLYEITYNTIRPYAKQTLNNIVKIKKGSNGLLALTDNNKLYEYNSYSNAPKALSTQGVKDFVSIRTNGTIVLDTRGRVHCISPTYATKNFEIDDYITSIIGGENGNFVIAIGQKGEYIVSSSSVERVDFNMNLVAGSNNYFIDENNNYYIISSDGTITKRIGKEEWFNEVPIVSNETLASFNIKPNSLNSRAETYDIEFNLVSNKEPKAFNLYYAKTADINNKSKWETIESNVGISSLNPVKYDTGYTNGDSNIMGTRYTYVWDISNEDLTNIQIIAEPIY